MSSVLELVDVHRTFNKGKPNEVRVLEGVNMSLAAGEVVALVAPSGAGKSTLLHVAGLLDTANSGEVKIDGSAVAKRPDRVRTGLRRNNVGFVYQFHHLLPEFTAQENVVLPQLAAGVTKADARERAAMLLEKVGLAGRMTHKPTQLSGGEQQRVAFCRALANAPKILLADEPTGNLDPDTADMVFNVLLDLVRDTGMSALIATHNHELAARMDRVLHMDHGKVT